MEYTVEDLSPVKKKVAITTDPKEVEAAIMGAVALYKTSVQIDGFRKGKVPASVIEQRFRDRIYEEARQDLVNVHINEVMSKLDVTPVSGINMVDGEPVMEERKQVPVELNESDGYGLMSPELAARWSSELGLDYVVSGVNTRFSWEKGMVFTFDFLDFAEKIAGTYMVKDAWGNEVDIRNMELVLTTSMLKLWDSYESCDAYVENCLKNKYTFGVAKTCPKELESERTLNYQFIQSYDLDDNDIEELIRPTMEEIKDVLYADTAKSILFLKGSGLNEKNVLSKLS